MYIPVQVYYSTAVVVILEGFLDWLPAALSVTALSEWSSLG